jgi:Ni/Co efflux regulator RcnB
MHITRLTTLVAIAGSVAAIGPASALAQTPPPEPPAEVELLKPPTAAEPPPGGGPTSGGDPTGNQGKEMTPPTTGAAAAATSSAPAPAPAASPSPASQPTPAAVAKRVVKRRHCKRTRHHKRCAGKAKKSRGKGRAHASAYVGGVEAYGTGATFAECTHTVSGRAYKQYGLQAEGVAVRGWAWDWDSGHWGWHASSWVWADLLQPWEVTDYQPYMGYAWVEFYRFGYTGVSWEQVAVYNAPENGTVFGQC